MSLQGLSIKQLLAAARAKKEAASSALAGAGHAAAVAPAGQVAAQAERPAEAASSRPQAADGFPLTAADVAELSRYRSLRFTPSAAAPTALPHPLSHYDVAGGGDLSQSAFLLPDVVSAEEESQLLSLISRSPACQWRQLKRRRLQMWGGHPSAAAFEPEALPAWQEQLIDRVSALLPEMFPPARRPDHVLLNEYQAGQGIMPHKDGPLYRPIVAILSLQAHTVMRFYRELRHSLPEQHQPALSVYIPPRSLFLFTRALYERLFHAIEERSEDELDASILNVPLELRGKRVQRDTRISLTIRRVRSKQEQEQATTESQAGQ